MNKKVIYLDDKTIGGRLKQLRKEAGLTQQQIADFIGCDQSHYSKLEHGSRRLTTSYLETLCTLYWIDEDDLIVNPGWVPRVRGVLGDGTYA